MKKVLALVLALAMVFSVSVVAHAEGTATLKFVAAPVTQENGIVIVELVAENIDKVSAVQISIEYDETKLELVSVTPASSLSGALVNSVVSEESTVQAGEIHIAWDATSPVSLSGVVVTFEFKAISSTLGDAYVGFMEGEDILFYDSSYEEVSTDVDEESEKVEIEYEHEHVYGDWYVSVEPKCETEGEERHDCTSYEGTCDAYETRTVKATGHKGGVANCLYPAQCEVCGSFYGDVDPDNHTGEVITVGAKEATCTEDGYTGDKYCGCEKFLESGEVIPATGHDWNDATCTTPKTCSVCGETEGEALGHKDENKDHVCDNGCGEYQGEHKDSETDNDHVCDYGCGVAFSECSDKSNDGDHNCDVCGAENVTEHVYSDAVCDAPATCDECGLTTGSALGHADENNDHVCDRNCGKTDVNMDKHVDENKDHVCDYGCSEAIGEHKDSAADSDHVCDYGCGAVLEACSDKSGDGDHNCDVCGAENITAHIGGEADCKRKAQCEECGKEYGEIDPDNHRDDEFEDVYVGYLAPTCTKDGHSGMHQHGYCGHPIDTGYVIPATGHTWGDWEVTTEPTCTEKGEETRVCSVCGDSASRPVDMVPHKGGEASCTDKAVCEVCKEPYGELEKHAYGNWVVVKEATRNSSGLKQRTCSECGDVESVEIPKLKSDVPNPGVTIKDYTDGKSDGETNPNTGAVSVIGIIALAAAGCCAAVGSSKKNHK